MVAREVLQTRLNALEDYLAKLRAFKTYSKNDFIKNDARHDLADLCDEFEFLVKIAAPLFRDYGQIKSFCGEITTIKVFEDNALVRQALETEGRKRVLVVDGGASVKVALVGDQLAQIAYDNGWAGIVVNGCIRDSAEIAKIQIGLKALNTVPKKSAKKALGEVDVPIEFARVVFNPGSYLYADLDGLIVAKKDLLMS